MTVGKIELGEGPQMATPPQAPRLSTEQRRALEMLSRSKRSGCTLSLLAAHGFTVVMLSDLVRDGLVAANTETIKAPGRTIEIVRVKITGAGERAIKSE